MYLYRTDTEMMASLDKWFAKQTNPDEVIHRDKDNDLIITPRIFIETMKANPSTIVEFCREFRRLAKDLDKDPCDMLENMTAIKIES